MRLLWLSTDVDKVRLRSEQVLATARVALASGALIARYLDTSEGGQHAGLVSATLVAYVVLSLIILAGIRSISRLSPWISHLLFGVDVLFAGVVTLFTSGSSSPFFVFFWFVLLSAAFRHGLAGCIRAAALLIAIVLGQIFLLPYLDPAASTDINFIVARITYLLVMAFLVGYFAQKEQDLRTEAVVVARSLARARGERTFARGLQGALEEVGAVFDVTRAILALQGPDGTRRCWQWQRVSRETGRARIEAVVPNAQEAFFFPLPPEISVWHTTIESERAVAALDIAGERARLLQQPPPAFWGALGAESVVGVVTTLNDGSIARLYLPDPSSTTSSAFTLHLMHVVSTQLGPALHNLSLLESETAANERSRLARELHDRVLQSLIGVEMQLAVMHRGDAPLDRVRHQLRDVHALLKAEIGNVRDLMNELRPIQVEARDLPKYLTSQVERFQSETGIRALLHCEVETVALSPQQCGDLVRLVQEALVNVRKHSGATAVRVRLASGAAGLTLTIEDDGCGFGFEGRLHEDQLWADHRGPRVIKERARAIGAALSIESHPGQGARLDLTIPYAI